MMRAARVRRWWAGLLAAAACVAAPSLAGAGVPKRIVSLNLCSDQILLDLVPRERIAALSFLAPDPTMSVEPQRAEGLPIVRGEAEEVLALNPDLVLAGAYSTPATQDLLKRLGVPVVAVPLASSFAEIRDVVRVIAKAAGEEARGEDMIRAFDARLAAARAPEGATPPTALAYQVNSLASGPGSLLDEMLIAAGFKNYAAGRTLGPGGRLPLETMVMDPPDVLVFANAPDDFRTVLGDNLRHPGVRFVVEHHPSMHLPMPLWLCGTQHTAEAVARLAAVRASLSTKGDHAWSERP